MEDHIVEFYNNCIQELDLYVEYAHVVFENLEALPKTISTFLIQRCYEIQISQGPEIEKILSLLFVRDAVLENNKIFEEILLASGMLKSFYRVLELTIGCKGWENMPVLFESKEGSCFYISILMMLFIDLASKANTHVVKLYYSLKDNFVPFSLVKTDPYLSKPYYIKSLSPPRDDIKSKSTFIDVSAIKMKERSQYLKSQNLIESRVTSNKEDIESAICRHRRRIYDLLNERPEFDWEDLDTAASINGQISELLNKHPKPLSDYVILHMGLVKNIKMKSEDVFEQPDRYPKARIVMMDVILELETLLLDDGHDSRGSSKSSVSIVESNFSKISHEQHCTTFGVSNKLLGYASMNHKFSIELLDESQQIKSFEATVLQQESEELENSATRNIFEMNLSTPIGKQPTEQEHSNTDDRISKSNEDKLEKTMPAFEKRPDDTLDMFSFRKKPGHQVQKSLGFDLQGTEGLVIKQREENATVASIYQEAELGYHSAPNKAKVEDQNNKEVLEQQLTNNELKYKLMLDENKRLRESLELFHKAQLEVDEEPLISKSTIQRAIVKSIIDQSPDWKCMTANTCLVDTDQFKAGVVHELQLKNIIIDLSINQVRNDTVS